MALEIVGDIEYEVRAHVVDFGEHWISETYVDLEVAQTAAQAFLDNDPTVDFVLIVKMEVIEKVERG